MYCFKIYMYCFKQYNRTYVRDTGWIADNEANTGQSETLFEAEGRE